MNRHCFSAATTFLLASTVLVSLFFFTPTTVHAQVDDHDISGVWEGYNSAGELIRVTASANLDGSYTSNVQIVEPSGETGEQFSGFGLTDTDEHASVITVSPTLDQLHLVWYSADAYRLTWPDNTVGIFVRVTDPATAGFPGMGGVYEITTGSLYEFSGPALETINQLSGTWTGETEFGLGTMILTVEDAATGLIVLDLTAQEMPRSDPLEFQVVSVDNGTVTLELEGTQGAGGNLTLHLNTPGTELIFSLPDMEPIFFAKVQE